MNVFTRIADRYTEDPDPMPELTIARFFAGMADRVQASATHR